MMDSSFVQEINFQGSEGEFSVGVISQDVRIKCSAGDHDHGSSKMKLTDMVDFNFGLRLCPGHLIAIHRTGQYIAYGLKTKDHGMVRVINTNTKQKTLIKGVRGLIYDIAFAFCTAEILISFVDEDGTLFVYEIVNDEAKTELRHKMVVQLAAPKVRGAGAAGNRSNSSRVTWCPYVPSFGEDEASCAEHSKLLVLLRLGGSAEVLDVGELARSDRQHFSSDDDSGGAAAAGVDGYVRLDECHSSVVDASFSPDGTALATAGQDGYVKFFQVFLRDGERPRCLHEWRPHDGKALSSLLFLDNINAYGTDCKFWKFAVTGALNNSELKVWSCETWTCTQTLVFLPDPCAISPDLYLKARLDATGTYLLLTETNNRLLYVFQIHRDDARQQAAVDSIAEFLLPAACISFCVRSAGVDASCAASRKKHLTEPYLQDDLDMDDEDDDDDDTDEGVDKDVNIHMYLMQTKCLQECRLVFRPETTDLLAVQATASPPPIATAATNAALAGAEAADIDCATDLKLDDLQTSVQQLIFKLDDHNDDGCSDGDDITRTADVNDTAASAEDAKADADADGVVSVANFDAIDVAVDNLIDIDIVQSAVSGESLPSPRGDGDHAVHPNHNTRTVVERNFASGGSSPSREVQEILLSLQSVQSELPQQQHVVVAAAAAAATASYTPKQFFESLTKLQQHSQQQLKVVDSTVGRGAGAGGQDWPDVPKLSSIELEQQQQLHKRLEGRIEALEGLLRRHFAQSSATATTTAAGQQQQLSGVRDDIVAAFAAHAQHVTSALEEQRRSVDATVQTAVARAAAAAAAAAKPPVAKQPHAPPPALQIDSGALAAAVQQELKCTVLPLVQATFEQLHRSLDTQHTQRLSHLDNLLRSNVQRLFAQCAGPNKSVVADALSGALVQMVRPGLEAQYRDLVASSLVPAWEKVCEAMFHQIHATFTQGTKEYCTAMERYCADQQRQQQQVQQQLQAQVSCAFSRLEVTLADVVREEVRASTAALSDAGGNVDRDKLGGDTAKRAPTPAAPHINQLQQQQQLVKRLLQRGTGDRDAVCEAFQVALSASDTALVLYVCEHVPAHEIFGAAGACTLPQHVLLSLIQQLAISDLTQHTDLKHCYLEEALLALDMNSAVAREHGPTVLKDLLKQLAVFLTAHPTHKNARSMRMLHMVAQTCVRNRDNMD